MAIRFRNIIYTCPGYVCLFDKIHERMDINMIIYAWRSGRSEGNLKTRMIKQLNPEQRGRGRNGTESANSYGHLGAQRPI
jgi:hypothetical protein